MTEILKGSAYERWIAPSMEDLQESKPPPVEEVQEEVIEDLDAENAPELPTLEEIEAIQQDAHDEGFAQGREEGLKAAEIENKHILDEELAKLEEQRQQLEAQRAELAQQREALGEEIGYFQQLLENMNHPISELDEVLEEQLLHLTINIARQLIRRELKTDPGEIIAVIREAISILPVSDNKIAIYLHPDDMHIVTDTLSLGEGDERGWRLIEDPMMARGGCRVVSNDSQVDASVEKRLTAVATRLLGGERGHEHS
jgi:flagellar assembly protein FliH